MTWSAVGRVLIVAAVAYAAAILQPIPVGGLLANLLFAAALAGLLLVFEAGLRQTASSRLIGAILGCAIGLGGLYGWRWYEARQTTQAETASARYEEMIDAFQRNDRPRGMTIVDELNRDYDWTPYAALSTLIAARVHVEQNELADVAGSGLAGHCRRPFYC